MTTPARRRSVAAPMRGISARCTATRRPAAPRNCRCPVEPLTGCLAVAYTRSDRELVPQCLGSGAEYALVAADRHHRDAHLEVTPRIRFGCREGADGNAGGACAFDHGANRRLHFGMRRIAQVAVIGGQIRRPDEYAI